MSLLGILSFIWDVLKDMIPLLNKICKEISIHEIKACLWQKCIRQKPEITLVYAALYPQDDVPGNKSFTHHKRKSPKFSSSGFFRVSPAVSEAEVRSIAYLSSMLTSCECELKIASDEQMDTDMSSNIISFGFACLKTSDNLADNPFIAHHCHNMLSIKTYDNPFHKNPEMTFGFIFRDTKDGESTNSKISRISCAGFNEWGTSGAAYFFSKKYHIISRYIRNSMPWYKRILCKYFTGLPDFMAVINTTDGMDENTKLLELWLIDDKTKNPRRIYPSNGESTHPKIPADPIMRGEEPCSGSCPFSATEKYTPESVKKIGKMME